LSQIEFVHRLAKMKTDEIIKKLQYIQQKTNSAGLIVNITGGAKGLDTAGAEIAQRFGRFGPPQPRCENADWRQGVSLDAPKAEVFASKSLQVGFAAQALNAAPFDTVEQVAEMVLTHQLSTGALWEDIRMKGGAYGAFVNSDCLENCMSFATYRDPNPMRSLEVFSQILKNNSPSYLQHSSHKNYLEKSVIGCYSKETRPRTAAEDGLVDFYRFLYGIEDSYRKNRLERLVSVSADEVACAFAALASKQKSGPVIIAGEKTANEAAKELGVEVQHLSI